MSTALEETIDAKIKDLATTASSAQVDGGWWAKFIAGALVAMWAWYMKYQLDNRDAELAKAASDLADAKIEADKQLTEAKSKVLSDAENLSQQQAQTKMANVLVQEKALADAQVAHQARMAAVEKLKNWQDLNALAGVK